MPSHRVVAFSCLNSYWWLERANYPWQKRGRMPDDEATITLAFANGSMGTIHYVANGHESFPKERIECLAVTVFCGWTISAVRSFGWPGLRTIRWWRQDKGHFAGAQAFVDVIRAGGGHPFRLTKSST